MGHPIARTLTLNAAVADGYAQAQTKVGAGALTLNGSLVVAGVGTPNVGRRVLITTVADESARTFTINGTSQPQPGSTGILGPVISEAITAIAAGSTGFTNQDFATVTSITVDAGTAGNVSAGTNSVGSDIWVPFDRQALVDFEVTVAGYVLSGGPTWQIDVTYDDVFGTWLPSGVAYPRSITWPALTGKTGTATGTLTGPITAARLMLVDVGSVQATFNQMGN